jgi:hypothetical protein
MVAVVVTGLGIGVLVQRSGPLIKSELTASAVDHDTGASLSIVVKASGGGAQVQATVYGLRPEQQYQLFGVTTSGQTQVVSRWTGKAGANSVTGTVSSPPSGLAFFSVATVDGTPVVTVRVAP